MACAQYLAKKTSEVLDSIGYPCSRLSDTATPDSTAAGMGPGRILLIGVGVVCALMVLALIIEGPN